MKTAIQWLKEYLETKVLPCPEGNEYVYGMNVAHNNLIEYMIPYLLEKEKEQIMNAYSDGAKGGANGAKGQHEHGWVSTQMKEKYYNQTYKPETI